MSLYRPPILHLHFTLQYYIFFNNLDKCLTRLPCFINSIILGEDFNIYLNLDKIRTHSFEFLLKSHGLFVTNCAPTHGDKCLDTLATLLNTRECVAVVADPIIADHCSAIFSVPLQRVSNKTHDLPWFVSYNKVTRPINEDTLYYFKLSWINKIH